MSKINKIRLSGTDYDIQDVSATSVAEVTQQQYDNLPATAKTDNILYIITDAQGADLSNYYTKSETDNAITAATATKQDTLVSGTNIKTINNTSILGSGNITIQGGGSSYTAGRGIDIANDTISVSLPISAGTASDNSALIFNHKNNISSAQLSTAFGIGTKAGGRASFSIGASTYANGEYSFVGGNSSQAIGNNSFAFGYAAKAQGEYSIAIGSYYTLAENNAEVALGKANVSNTGSTDADKTLFSVGNGTNSSNRHNAFEIRQNGDIYLSLNGQDVKLQDQLGGGGSSYTAGRGIDITNDTISVSLPISAGTGTNALTIASDTYDINNKATGDYSVCLNGGGYHPNYAYGTSSFAQGMDTKAYGAACHSEGHGSKAGVENNYNIQYAHAEGDHTQAKGTASHTEGIYTIANNESEHASGKYNVSNTGSTSADNTLFSVGNGTSTSARHNAFEIRQNGDIYCSDGTNDVKLQDTITATAANTTALGGKVDTSAITTSISSSSTDSQIPSAKAVYDMVGNINTILESI